MNKVKPILYDKIRFLKIKKSNFTEISVDVNIQTSAAHFVACESTSCTLARQKQSEYYLFLFILST